jgi:parallel beta-helix repeat protein
VTSFGARGDGATDDTAAIARARDAAGSGGTVVFPAGTYVISGVSLNIAGQRWWLDPAATLRMAAGASTTLVRISASDVVLTGGRLDGNAASQSSSGTCVSISAPRATIDGVDIGGCRGWGIYIRGAPNAHLVRNVVHDTGDASIFIESDDVRGADNAVVELNTVRRTANSGAGGIVVHGNGQIATRATRIAGNRVENVAQISIEVWGFAPNSVIVDNVTVGGWMGISVDQSDDSQVLRNRVIAARTYGIELAGSQRCVVRNNTVDHTGIVNGTGIALTGIVATSRGNLLDANTLIGANRGIQLNTGAHDNTISGNVIQTWTMFGIELIASERIKVTGNTISSGGSQAVALDNSLNVEIVGNTVRAARTAVGLYGHGGVTVDYVTVTQNVFQDVGVGLSKAGTVGTHITYDGP